MNTVIRLYFFIFAQTARSCPGSAIQISQVTLAYRPAIKKYSLNFTITYLIPLIYGLTTLCSNHNWSIHTHIIL